MFRHKDILVFFSPPAKRGRGERGVWGEFRRARAQTSARLRLLV